MICWSGQDHDPVVEGSAATAECRERCRSWPCAMHNAEPLWRSRCPLPGSAAPMPAANDCCLLQQKLARDKSFYGSAQSPGQDDDDATEGQGRAKGAMC